MTRGEMVQHAQEVHSCREVYDVPPAVSAARAWLPLAYDTVIFLMTLWRTLPSIRDRGPGRILHTLLLDGTLYYTVICSANSVLTVMIIRAPPGLKGVAAQLVFLLTVVMTSRVTLNLRKQAELVLNLSCDQHRPCSIYSPTLLTSTSLLRHRQMLFADNPQLRSQCSTVVSSAPTSPISMDADLTDDGQSFGGRLSLNRTCADVESARYGHVLSQ
ncbi:hypothetical protein DFH29DRAFT_333045 [Suillus ampliporus]|nr:hypothetical protein DFH29DRAFT_333045 [Suillus ampliporus]